MVNLLGVCLFQESAPEFILGFRFHVDELSVDGGQSVVNDNVSPLSQPPEPEMEDTLVLFRLFWCKNLFFVVGNDLENIYFNLNIGNTN